MEKKNDSSHPNQNEESMVSQTESSIKKAAEHPKFQDLLISLISETNRTTKNSGILLILTMIVLFVQMILGFLFCLCENHQIPEWLFKVTEVFYLGYNYEKLEDARRFVMFGIILASALIILLILVQYQYFTHEFSQISLYIVRYWFGQIFKIFIFPTFSFTANSLIYFGHHPVVGNALIALIYLLLALFLYFIAFHLTTNLEENVYITNSPLLAFRNHYFYRAIYLYAIPFFVMPLTSILEDYAQAIPAIVLILVSPLYYLNTRTFPFETSLLNSSYISFPVFSIVSAIIHIIDEFTDNFPQIAYLVIPLAAFFIAHIATMCYIIFIREKNIVKQLSAGTETSAEDKFNIFENMKIDASSATYVLQTGFVNKCPLFLDWSLTGYLTEKYPDDMNILSFATWLISFFPSETKVFRMYLTRLDEYPSKTFEQQCLLYQLHLIFVFRESSSASSTEASADYKPVRRQSDNVVAYISTFWQYIANDPNELQDSVFTTISAERRHAETMWTKLLEKYPNNAQMIHDYARYLENGESKFNDAIKYHQKALSIESGTRLIHDKAFRCFLQKYPAYLKRGYVNTAGKINKTKLYDQESQEETQSTKLGGRGLNEISPSLLSMSSMPTINTSAMASETSVGLDEGDEFLAEAQSFIKQHVLKTAMEKAIDQYESPILPKIRFTATVRFILTVALSFIIFFVVYFQFPEQSILFNHLINLQHVIQYSSIIGSLAPWFWISSLTEIFPEEHFYKDFKYKSSFIDLSQNFNITLVYHAREALSRIDVFTQGMYDSDEDDLLTSFSDEYSQKLINNTICNNKLAVFVNSDPESTSFDSFFREFLSIGAKISKYDLEYRHTFYNSDNFADFFHKVYILQTELENLLSIISPSISESPSEHEIYTEINFNENEMFPSTEAKLLSKSKNIKDKHTESQETDDNSDDNQQQKEENSPPLYKFTKLNRKAKTKQFSSIKKSILNFFGSLKKSFYSKSEKKALSNKTKHNLLLKIKHQLAEAQFSNSSQKLTIPSKNLHLAEDEENEDEEGIYDEEEEDEEEEDESITIESFFIGFTPFFIALFALPSLILLSTSMQSEKTKIVTLLMHTHREEAKNASENISGRPPKATIHMSSQKQVSTAWIWSALSMITVIVFLILIAAMSNAKLSDEHEYVQHVAFTILEQESVFGIGRDIVYYIFQLYVNNHDGPIHTGSFDDEEEIQFDQIIFTNLDFIASRLDFDFDAYDRVAEMIKLGTEDVDQVSGFDSEIDNIRFKEKCPLPTIVSNTDSFFTDCISFSRLLTYFIGQARIIYNTPDYYSINDSDFTYWSFLLQTRIPEDYKTLIAKYDERFNKMETKYNVLFIVFFILSILCALGSYVVEMALVQHFNRTLEIFRTLLLRLNPLYFVSNQELLSTVYKNGKNENQVSSSSHAMFQTAHDALILLKEDLIMESVNPATTEIFGFTPEQMLGQSIKFLLPNDTNSSMYYVIDLMLSGATSLTYETDATGLKDDGSEFPLRLSVIGLTSDNASSNDSKDDKKAQKGASTGGKKATAFAFILKDMTEERRQKIAVEEAKKEAENILLQILPKDIIMRLNRGDKDITFTVASATVIFIDIEKFSAYSATLATKDIMLNLSRIFTAYDKICSTFDLITKIKMIGDDYMAAAGLFTPDIDPKLHATQVVQFALQCLDAIEEQNIILNASLKVRIGINTDGPLIAGILGTEKPLFDIIGDTINVASRLQSTCIPGLIQISEGTHQHVADLNIKIEERGEIMLKGKGKRKTFLIYPELHEHKAGNFQTEMDSNLSSSFLQQMISQNSSSIPILGNKPANKK